MSGCSIDACDGSCAATCPLGLCDGSGLIAPHPSTTSADAGLDDPCPCREVPDAKRVCAYCDGKGVHTVGRTSTWCMCSLPGFKGPTVSQLEAAWAARDAAERAYDLKKEAAAQAQREETSAWAEVVRLERVARAAGPRPAKVPT